MKTTLFFVFLIFFNNSMASTTPETIELYGENNYPPFSDQQKNGLSQKVIQASYNAVGIKVNFQSMPFIRIIKMLDKNKILGGFNLIKTSQESTKYLFTESPIYLVKTYFYYLKSKPLHIKTLNDFNNPKLSIGQVLGFMYEQDFLDLTFSRHQVETEKQLVAMLALGRLDAAYITREAEKYYRKELNISEGIITPIKDVGVQDAPLYLGFNKQHPDAVKYAEAFNQGLKIIKKNGIYKKIITAFNKELSQ